MKFQVQIIRGYKRYATEGITLLEEFSSASEMYKITHRGQQTTLDQLEAEDLINMEML